MRTLLSLVGATIEQGNNNGSEKMNAGKENEPYFQDLYIKALDAVIAACEGKQ